MNICVVSREYLPETGWGGIGTYTYNLAHALTELGNGVHVIAQVVVTARDYLDEGVQASAQDVQKIKTENRRSG